MSFIVVAIIIFALYAFLLRRMRTYLILLASIFALGWIALRFGVLSSLLAMGLGVAYASLKSAAFSRLGKYIIDIYSMPKPTPEQSTASTNVPRIQTQEIIVTIDLNNNDINGIVLFGAHKNEYLHRLSLASILGLRNACKIRASLDLLDAYLDRAHPGWWSHLQKDSAPRRTEAFDARPMTMQEAYDILGVQDGAGEIEIRQAYRRLMKIVHPDVGGSAYLALQANNAKSKLFENHKSYSL